MISARSAAQLRKRALVEGTYGQFVPNLGRYDSFGHVICSFLMCTLCPIGGWDASWDEERKVYMLNAPRGHAHERDRAER
ncbi:hypothetical protein EON64_07175 [archaeon]|nr:MAG: hypothetical protein EON64_07175 [archaeon]